MHKVLLITLLVYLQTDEDYMYNNMIIHAEHSSISVYCEQQSI